MIKRALLACALAAMPVLAHAQSTSLTTILGPSLTYNPATGKLDVLPNTIAGTARDAAAAIAAENAAQAAASAAQAIATAAIPAAQMGKPLGPVPSDAQGTISAAIVQALGATVPLSNAARAGRVLTLEDFGAAGDGVTDDSEALTSACNAALSTANAQGARVVLLHKQYAMTEGGAIPLGCAVDGPGDLGNGVNWNTSIVRPMILLGRGAGVTMTVNGRLHGVAVARQGVSLTPPHIQDAVANLANYAGVGVTIGSTGDVDNILTLGNALGYSVSNANEWHASHLRSDDLASVWIDNMHDVSTIRDFEAFPWITAQDGQQVMQSGIVNIAANGSGNLRVTTSTPHGLVAGNPVTVFQVGGMTGANGRWTVLAVVDATHFDISASSTPSTTGTLVASSQNVVVASTVGLAAGQTVSVASGAGAVPAGTTILNVQPDTNTIELSVAPTTPGTATLAFTQSAYAAPASGSTNGSVALYAWERPGECVKVTASEAPTLDNGFCFGHVIGVHLTSVAGGGGSGWANVDNFQAESGDGFNPNTVGLLIDGNAYSSKIHLGGGDFSGFWSPLEIALAGGSTEPTLVEGGGLYSQRQPGYGPSAVRIVTGNAILSDLTAMQGDLFVGASGFLQLNSSDVTQFFGFGNQGYGSVLANITTSGTRFSDTMMATLRGGQGAALAVPNAAGTGYVFPIQVRPDGTPVVGTDGSQGNAQLLVKGYQASTPGDGAQLVFWNTAQGAATPFKFESVGADGSWRLLSADHARQLIKADDNGDMTFSRHVVNTGTPLTAANLANCGTIPSINGNDRRGTVTPGAGATGCVINLIYTYPSYPFATLTPGAANMGLYVSYTNNNQLVVGFSTPGPFTYVLEQ